MRYKIVALLIFIILIMMITPSFASVNIQSQYNVSTKSVSPYIVYNNTHNYPPFAETTTNKYHTLATSDITSVWVDAAYSDDNCTMATNSYGYTILYSYTTGKYNYIGSPYNSITKYYGPVTGIAGTKSYDGTGGPIIVLLTQYGYIFYYYQGSWALFTNSGNDIIKLPGSDWASLTANTYASTTQNYFFIFSGTATYFYATNVNGTIYYWDTYTGDYGLFNSYKSPYDIISTAAYCDETSTSDNNLYGLSYSGYVYYLTTSGWDIYNTTPLPSGSVSIAISGLDNPYMYALNIHNNTSLYVSENTITSSSSSAFSKTTGIIDNKQTNEALTVYCGDTVSYPIFFTYQTNGTILYNLSDSADTTAFNWNVLGTIPFGTYNYPAFLALNEVNTITRFNVTLLYDGSTGLENINNISIYYNNSKLYKEFSFIHGILNKYNIPINITYSIPVTVNLTLRPNSSYNAYMQFSVLYFYKGVYISYILNINIINHFSYWNIG